MPADLEIKVRTRSRLKLWFIPLFTLQEEVHQPNAPAPRRTALAEVLQRPAAEGDLQLRSRQIKAAGAVDVDEQAEVDKAISDQYLRASEVGVDTQLNWLYVEFNKEAALGYRGLLAQIKVTRLRRMMTTMPQANLGTALQELQDFMAGMTETAAAPIAPTPTRTAETAEEAPAQNGGDAEDVPPPHEPVTLR